MPGVEIAKCAIAAALTVVLLWAGASDIVTRRIPNLAVLAVVALFVLWALIDRGQTLGSALAAGGIAFGVGYLMYMFNVMGAGDVKLFAAVSLFAGLVLLPALALATVWSGGAIALVSIISRPRRAAVMFALRGKGDFGRGIPYGVAIAFGGMVVIWGALGGLLPL